MGEGTDVQPTQPCAAASCVSVHRKFLVGQPLGTGRFSSRSQSMSEASLARKLLRAIWCIAGDVQVTREQQVTSHKPGAVLASPSQCDPLSLKLVIL